MLPEFQREFAERYFSQEKYRQFLKELDDAVGMKIEYRVSEMPVFVSNSFKHELETAAIDIAVECMLPEHLTASNGSLKPEYTVANQNPKPLFVIVDFAVALDENGNFIPKVVELQGFPSLFGYQFVLAKHIKDFYQFDRKFDHTFSGLSNEDYVSLMKKALLGNHTPDECCLLEYQPHLQKTRPDFLCTNKLTGIKETDICSVRKDGNLLFHERNGNWQQIRRIYNRTIIDELNDNNVTLPFNWGDDLDVEWAGHPNWYFRISKYSLPFLHHKSVPKSIFLDTLESIPSNLDDYVLKPLFSFAGKGVIINPTEKDILSIPKEGRGNFVLQERITYAESLYTPLGMNKVELRIMMIWLEEWEKPVPVMSLARTGRGPMMGVRYNSVEWSGSTGCLFGD
ncbi:MAG: hypothetical protein HYZ54_00615 [Ignavibacteriae bacterium]|nr:hypothetical protein [Ignavibacteriota bacterium]